MRDRVPSFEAYPFSIPAIRHLHELDLHPEITFLIGENGSGKSTLLEALAVVEGFNPEGGSRNFDFRTRDSHSSLCQTMRLQRGSRRLGPSDGWFFRAESFYNVATEIDNNLPMMCGAYGGKSLHEQSHGEAFFSLLLNRFRGNGLYLLDEPESALSPSRQIAMLRAIYELIQAGSQFIIATHSPIIMAYPGARIFQLAANGISVVNYEETEHYSAMWTFLTHREQMLKELMSDS